MCIATVAGYLDSAGSRLVSMVSIPCSVVLSEWRFAGTRLVAGEDLGGTMVESKCLTGNQAARNNLFVSILIKLSIN